MFDLIVSDLRNAVRVLLRRPAFSAAVVCTLALGIGANTAIFSFVDGVLLRPLPYPSPERLMTLWENLPASGKEVASYPDYLDWREQARSFERMGAYANGSSGIAPLTSEPERVASAIVDGELFETLGLRAEVGRLFTSGDHVFGAHRVVVLSDALWRRRFGADPKIVGQSVLIEARPYTVIGVAPAAMRTPEGAQLWTPYAADPKNGPLGRRSDFLNVIGRLKPGVTVAQAQREMDAIGRRLAQTYPRSNDRVGVLVHPLHDEMVGPVKSALLVFAAAVGLVLLIACANVANLLLARATARHREMAVRVAIGAGRGRLMRQMLSESLVVAIVGGALGLLLAVWGVQALKAAAPPSLPRLAEVGIDGRVLAFSLVVSLATGVLFGLAPALRVSTLAVRGALSESTRGSTGGPTTDRLRNGLVLAQVALALVLLAGSGLLVRSFERMQRVDLGFDATGVASAAVVLPSVKYGDPARAAAFFEALRARLAATPGVRSVGFTTDVPLARDYNYNTISITGRPPAGAGQNEPDAISITADAGYFTTMRIPIVAGRAFEPQDRVGSLNVAIVNREFVRRYMNGRDPIGQRVSFNPSDSTAWMTIVGVTADARLAGARREVYPQVYDAFAQDRVRYGYAVVKSDDAGAALTTIRRAVAEIDATQPLSDAKRMEDRLSDSFAQARLNSMLVGAFSLLALVLASVGIYGVVSYAVAQRTREIGIRIALGATTSGVLRLVVRQGMAPAILGIVVGLGGAFAATRLLSGLLYGVSASDPLTFALVTVVLAAVAFVACLVPARRAAHVDPVDALRSDG